jgi:hypothetical protein
MPIFNKINFSFIPSGRIFVNNQLGNHIGFIKWKKNIFTRRKKIISIEVEGIKITNFIYEIRKTKIKNSMPMVFINTSNKKILINL